MKAATEEKNTWIRLGWGELEVAVVGEVPGAVQNDFLFLHFFCNILNFLVYLMTSQSF